MSRRLAVLRSAADQGKTVWIGTGTIGRTRPPRLAGRRWNVRGRRRRSLHDRGPEAPAQGGRRDAALRRARAEPAVVPPSQAQSDHERKLAVQVHRGVRRLSSEPPRGRTGGDARAAHDRRDGGEPGARRRPGHGRAARGNRARLHMELSAGADRSEDPFRSDPEPGGDGLGRHPAGPCRPSPPRPTRRSDRHETASTSVLQWDDQFGITGPGTLRVRRGVAQLQYGVLERMVLHERPRRPPLPTDPSFPGDARYYLVRAQNQSNASTWGIGRVRQDPGIAVPL